MTAEEELLLEQVTSAHRERRVDGTIRSHPAWHDLDDAGREAAFDATVSLLLLGVALLARQGVGNQLVQWKGGVQFIVFMKADATEDQIQSVRTALAESPQVDDAKTRTEHRGNHARRPTP